MSASTIASRSRGTSGLCHDGAIGAVCRCCVITPDRVVADERRTAGGELVEHRTEGVEVGAGVGRVTGGLLGREVRDGSDHQALGGEPRLVGRGGEPEVAEQRGAVGA